MSLWTGHMSVPTVINQSLELSSKSSKIYFFAHSFESEYLPNNKLIKATKGTKHSVFGPCLEQTGTGKVTRRLCYLYSTRKQVQLHGNIHYLFGSLEYMRAEPWDWLYVINYTVKWLYENIWSVLICVLVALLLVMYWKQWYWLVIPWHCTLYLMPRPFGSILASWKVNHEPQLRHFLIFLLLVVLTPISSQFRHSTPDHFNRHHKNA